MSHHLGSFLEMGLSQFYPNKKTKIKINGFVRYSVFGLGLARFVILYQLTVRL